jgi:hypothetical protein
MRPDEPFLDEVETPPPVVTAPAAVRPSA